MKKAKRMLLGLVIALGISIIPNTGIIDDMNITAAEQNITVEKSNFLDYFQLHGAATYDASTGLLDLTKNEMGSVGNASLKTKVKLDQPFSLKLSVNLGDKSQSQGGADGMGFVFHTDAIGSIGTGGNGFGAGGLNDVFGFKLDTSWNDHDQDANYSKKDPTYPGYDQAFGAFMYTDSGTYLRTYETSDPQAEVKAIPNAADNTFRDFEITYDGAGTMNVTYDGITWELDVETAFNISDVLYSFSISASTGYYYNYHQVYFKEFTYGADRGVLNVRHEDTDGNLLTAQTTTLGNPTLTNEAYTTTQQTFTNYTFKEMKSGSDSTTGIYEAGISKTVTYVYARDTGTLVVRHEDESGTLLEPATSSTVATGQIYTAASKSFIGYTFKEVKAGSAAESGVYEKDVSKTVTYVYTRDTGTLVIRHEDESGALLEAATSSTTGTGESYTSAQKNFTGYTFKEVKAGSAAESGVYEKDVTKTIIYVYTRDMGGLIVRHEDEEGMLLEPQQSTTKETGESYTTTSKSFSGYTFKEIKTGSVAESGVYEKDVTKNITYVYTRDTGSLVVSHEDEDGNLLEPIESTIKPTGEVYSTSKKEFSGYTFKEIKTDSDAESGIYEKDVVKTITYVYTKDRGTLVVRHEDEDGNLLEIPTITIRDAGEIYTTSKKAFVGYTFKEIKADSATFTGVYETNVTKTITYIYKRYWRCNCSL